MDKKVILTKSQIEKLCVYLEIRLKNSSCDHTLKWTNKWAENHKINKDDLIDVLDENSGFCDCEVTLNLPEDIDLTLERKEEGFNIKNPFKIPINYQYSKTKYYNKAVFSKKGLTKKCFSEEEEILFPASENNKPKMRMRKLFHYFNGAESELPSELGIIKSIEPITAREFAKRIRAKNLESFRKVQELEAAYYLSQVGKFELDTVVGVNFVNRMRDYKNQIELKIHKVKLK